MATIEERLAVLEAAIGKAILLFNSRHSGDKIDDGIDIAHALTALQNNIDVLKRFGTFNGQPTYNDELIKGERGEVGADGAPGNDGWTPVLAIINDGDRRVLQITDWMGGEGSKPSTGLYVGSTGLVTDISQGIDIRGEKGRSGQAFVPQGRFDTLAELKAAVPSPEIGDAFSVGTTPPFLIYSWGFDDTLSTYTWINQGHIQGEKGERGADATINGENVIEIIDSDTVVVDIADGQMQFHATGTSPYVFYLARKNGNAVFTLEKPTENQVIFDRIWRPVTWGEWSEIGTIEIDPEMLNQEPEIVVGNLFTSKLWISSDIAIPNAQFKLTITDKTDGTELVSAFDEINLNNINTILTPAMLINKFLISRQISIDQLQITLSVLVLASAVQLGVVSVVPAQLSFATITAATGGGVGESNIAWLPEVSAEGDLSWTRSDTTIPPESRNVRGTDGKDAEMITLTATIPTVWSEIAPYTQTVAIPNININMSPPIVDIMLPDDVITALPILEAWSMVDKIVIGDGNITVTCFQEKPQVEMPIQLKIIQIEGQTDISPTNESFIVRRGFVGEPVPKLPPRDVYNLRTEAGSQRITLKWNDPDDTTVDSIVLAKWAMTTVVRKKDSFPNNENDGIIVVNNSIRNQYADEGFVDTNLENDVTYYYQLFPRSTSGAVNRNETNRISDTPLRIVIDTVPSQKATLTYNGNTQSPLWDNYDSSQLTIGGVTSSINAGTYTATFTPTEQYKWKDGTTTAKNVTWTIGKAAGSLSIAPTSLTLNATNLTGTITVTRAGDGAISAVSSNTSVATVSISGNTVTVNNVGQTSGSATITVSVAAGTNHLSPSSQSCAVSAEFIPTHSKTFGNNTWTQISAVSNYIETNSLTAAQITTTFGWTVGDTKLIVMSGANYYLRIIGINHDNKPTGGKAGISLELTYSYGLAISNRRYMNSTKTNISGWESSFMRQTVMPEMKNLLPSDLQSVIKRVNKLTSAGNESSIINTTQDDLWQLSELELTGGLSQSASGEGARYAYYTANTTAAARIKQQPPGTNYDWWLRSPAAYYTDSFCFVTSTGTIDEGGANITKGVSFCLCV